jgi:hypothetical protein
MEAHDAPVLFARPIRFFLSAAYQSIRSGLFTPTGCGTPEVFRSDSVGKFGCSDSETWLPLL